MIQTLINKAKEGLKDYIRQLESDYNQVDVNDIECYFESILYRDLVDLHRKHSADDVTIAGYVRAFNDLVEYQLNLHYFQKELDIILSRPRNEQERKLSILERSVMSWLTNNDHAAEDVEVIELLRKLEEAIQTLKKNCSN